MKLISARIENFRCVENSEEFSLSDVTCLVGKNESGKTSLLTALYRLNPHNPEDIAFDKDLDNPRRKYVDYEDNHTEEARVLTTRWGLSADEIKSVRAALGPDGFPPFSCDDAIRQLT